MYEVFDLKECLQIVLPYVQRYMTFVPISYVPEVECSSLVSYHTLFSLSSTYRCVQDLGGLDQFGGSKVQTPIVDNFSEQILWPNTTL